MKERIRDNRGNVIGECEAGVLRKTVEGSRHFFRQRRAILWDLAALEKAGRLHARLIETTDAETEMRYVATYEQYFGTDSFEYEHPKYGKQRGLPLVKHKSYSTHAGVAVELQGRLL